jgi:hypothetical protein
MLLSESKFLQAGRFKGFLTTGVAQALFNDGIQASFTYLGATIGTYAVQIEAVPGLDGLPRPIKFNFNTKWIALAVFMVLKITLTTELAFQLYLNL